MRYVIEVAKRRSFTRAAEGLHVAQQALSQQVKSVEEQLGVTLFDRTSRGVEPTAAGEVFVAEARRVVNAADRLVARTEAAGRGEAGRLRIAYTVTTVYETLPAIVDRIGERYPALGIDLREVLGADVEALLAEDRHELAICPRTVLGPGLDRRELRHEPFVAALGSGHELAASGRVALAGLADETLQLWPRELSPGFYDAVLDTCRGAGFEPRVDPMASGSTVWGNIAGGRGFGLVVGSLANQVPRGIVLLELEEDAQLTIDAVFPSNCRTPAVQRVLELGAELADERGWLAVSGERA